MNKPIPPDTLRKMVLRTDFRKTMLHLAVPLMTVIALVWLGYQFWRLIWGSQPIWPTSPIGAGDMLLRYDEVQRWFSGKPVYSALRTAAYPPASMVLLWPLLGWLNAASARWLWAMASIAALGWSMVLLVRESGADTPLERLFVALMPLAIYPTGATIGNGQIIILLFPALVAGFVLLKKYPPGWSRDLLAAALLTITLVKPSVSVPFFLILLFMPGTLRTMALISIGYLVLTLFAASFQDPSLPILLREWLARLSGPASNGGYADLPTLLAALQMEGWSLPASLLVLITLGIWIHSNRQKDLWLLLGVTALIARSWTYHRWYDDVVILLPMVAFFRVAKQAPFVKESLAAAVLLAITLLAMLAPGGYYLLPPPWNNLYVIGQIIVWLIGLIFLLDLARRDKSPRAVD